MSSSAARRFVLSSERNRVRVIVRKRSSSERLTHTSPSFGTDRDGLDVTRLLIHGRGRFDVWKGARRRMTGVETKAHGIRSVGFDDECELLAAQTISRILNSI